jgi:hypothetical protein
LARRTVEQIVAPYPVVVAVNASFFDKEDPMVQASGSSA